MRLIGFVFITITILFSCRKETNNGPMCNGIPLNTDLSKTKIKGSDTFRQRPSCSPTNTDELFYGKQYNGFDESDLSYYNMKTHSQKSFHIAFIGIPSISATGWIAFTGLDLRLWKIKTNGDSLQYITNHSENEQQPEWSPDGKKLVYAHSTSFYKEVMINADGSGMKTIDSTGAFVAPSWSPDGSKIAFYQTDASGDFCGYYDVSTGKKVKLFGGGAAVSWFRDSKWLVAARKNGIYRINTITKEELKLKDACPFHSYDYPTVSADGRYIYTECIDYSKLDPNTLSLKGYICRMDSMGRNEEEVKF